MEIKPNMINRLLFAVTFLCLIQFSWSQNARIVDLKVRILEPKVASFIKSPGIISLKFSVINNGKGDLLPSDTISLYPKTNDSLFKYLYLKPSKIVHPRDSDIFIIQLPFNSKFDNNFYQVCILSAVAFNRSSDSLRIENLKQQIDNTACITVKHRSATSSMNSISKLNSLNLYPNPATRNVLIGKPDNTNSEYNLSIFDKHGVLVHKELVVFLSETTSFSLDFIDAGMYSIELNNGLSTFRSKFIKL
jgi:hypothetical protein